MSSTVIGVTCSRCLWSFVPRCKCGGQVVNEIPRHEDEEEDEDEKSLPGVPVCVSCRQPRRNAPVRCGCGNKRFEDLLRANAETKLMMERHQRRLIDQERWTPRPPCCEKARATHGRQESMGWDFPFVHLALDGKSWYVGDHQATHCPFCGSRFPEAELDPNAAGRFAEVDDCGHCMGCGNRYCGLCKPPSARFRIKTP